MRGGLIKTVCFWIECCQDRPYAFALITQNNQSYSLIFVKNAAEVLFLSLQSVCLQERKPFFVSFLVSWKEEESKRAPSSWFH